MACYVYALLICVWGNELFVRSRPPPLRVDIYSRKALLSLAGVVAIRLRDLFL